MKGAQLLSKKHIDASGMVSFFKKMEAAYKSKEGESSSMPEWLSSHPETLARIKFAEQYVAKNPCKACVPLVWDKPAILADLSKKREKE